MEIAFTQKRSAVFSFRILAPKLQKIADATTEQFRKLHKLETDLTGFYDTIPNYNLLDVLTIIEYP